MHVLVFESITRHFSFPLQEAVDALEDCCLLLPPFYSSSEETPGIWSSIPEMEKYTQIPSPSDSQTPKETGHRMQTLCLTSLGHAQHVETLLLEDDTVVLPPFHPASSQAAAMRLPSSLTCAL